MKKVNLEESRGSRCLIIYVTREGAYQIAGRQGKQEYLEAILRRYQLADKDEKQTFLDEFCRVYEYNRKYAMRLQGQGGVPAKSSENKSAGRPKRYHDPVMLEVLKRIWSMLNLPCSKRLEAVLDTQRARQVSTT